MESQPFATAILAAGKGTRLKSKRAKVLHSIAGKPLLQHVLDAVLTVTPPERIFVVVGHQAEQVERSITVRGVHFVAQTQQLGTGHAVQCLRESVGGLGDLLVLSGDVPLIRPETIENLLSFHQSQKAAMTILTARPDNPFGYGRVVRVEPTSPDVGAIIEQKALTDDQQHIGEINSGIYVFHIDTLYRHIDALKSNNAHGEYYLTDMAAILRAAGERVVAYEIGDATEVLGANTIAEMMELEGALRMQAAQPVDGAGSDHSPPRNLRDRCRCDRGRRHDRRAVRSATGQNAGRRGLPDSFLFGDSGFDTRRRCAGPQRLRAG